MKKEERYSLPTWMRIDNRPMDRGEWQTYGYGYSRNVGKRELWRPATRYFVRKDRVFNTFEEIQLCPDAYYVSDHGRIYSTIKQCFLSKRRKHQRKWTKLIDVRGQGIWVRPYRLALDNWIEPSDSIRSLVRHLMDTVNHKDGKAWNNNLNNLQYSPLSANVEHQNKVLHRTGKKKGTTSNGKQKHNT